VRRLLVILLLSVVALAGCSSGDDDQAASTTVASPTTTATSAGPSSTRAATVFTDCPDQPDSTKGSPPPTQGAAIGNGFFFGYITMLDAEDLKITFDAAQLLTGEAAQKAAEEDGGEATDFWIRNSSKATRTLPLAEDALLCTSEAGNPVANQKVSLAKLNQQMADGEPLAVWIDVRGGTVERVQQQYFP
jgi:hypothetical protein